MRATDSGDVLSCHLVLLLSVVLTIELDAMLFIETSSPPPFYQPKLTDAQRVQLDKWFIGKRSQAYYLRRFAKFDAQGYLSPQWHWAAFFMTFGWLLFRKRYMDAIVYSVAGWSFIQLNIVIILVAFEFLLMSFVPDAYQTVIRLIIAGLVWLFWSFMVARWTDAYYYRMARREIADALNDYPREPQAQKEHLQREGGVSLIGLGLGLGFFVSTLLIIKVQFLPLIAKPKENAIIYDTYTLTRGAQARVEKIYQQTKTCPKDMLLSSDSQKVNITVRTQVQGVPESSCAVVATIKNVPFPNRNLNGQTLILYRSMTIEATANQKTSKTRQWACTTSLNSKQRPRGCIEQ